MDGDRLAPEEEVNGLTINPWISRKPNYSMETGGDWYHLLLSTSLGCKAVHGANTAPTMEVLGKCRTFEPDMAGVGLLRRDKKCTIRDDVGSEISDLYYVHKPYLGTVTANSSILAYETGMWEPSMRRRAKSSALLAAGMYAHGCSLESATEVVSILSSDDMDPEAISSTIIPASHLKREMIITTKANHRIFSRGTLQSSIIWSDTHLGIGGNTSNIALDWGRVTALARYIAEANIQNCTMFTEIIENTGIPYQLVRNAWAYVSETDYHLTPSMFKNVPRIDVSSYGIPSMKGAFTGHEIDILLGLCNAGVDISKTIETDSFRGYRQLYDTAKGRKARRVSKSSVGADEIAQVDYITHAYQQEDIFTRLEVPELVTRSLIKAIATRIEYHKDTKRIYKQFLEIKEEMALRTDSHLDDNHGLFSVLDPLILMLMRKETWIMARVIAEDEIRKSATKENITEQIRQIISHLSNMKEDIFKYPSHLEQESHLMAITLEQSRGKVGKMIELASSSTPVRMMAQKDTVRYELRESAEILVKLSEDNDALILKVKEDLADKYYSIYAQCCMHHRPVVKKLGAKFSITGYALRNFQARYCCNKASGYIDGAEPLKSYVYKGVCQLSDDFDYMVPRLTASAYTHALQIAEELDRANIAPFDITHCVEFVINTLDNVVGNLMMNKLYEIPENMYDEFLRSELPPDSPPYDTTMMEEAERMARLEARFITQELKRPRIEKRPVDACRDTYPTPAMADEYAQLNGYEDFNEAFLILGIDSGYSEDSSYCYTARMKKATSNIIINESLSSSSSSDDNYEDVM